MQGFSVCKSMIIQEGCIILKTDPSLPLPTLSIEISIRAASNTNFICNWFGFNLIKLTCLWRSIVYSLCSLKKINRYSSFRQKISFYHISKYWNCYEFSIHCMLHNLLFSYLCFVNKNLAMLSDWWGKFWKTESIVVHRHNANEF